jgi:surface polysaccharide O-acyltransferase-like enzyme
MDVIAWAGLVVSWFLLLLMVKYVFIALRVLKQIRRLAEMSRDAAVALAANLAEADAFGEVARLAADLPAAVRVLPQRSGITGTAMRSSLSPGIGGRTR